MQIKAKVGYRTAPGELSFTPLLVGHPCPVTHFCHKKPYEPPKSLRDKSPKKVLEAPTLGQGRSAKAGYRTDHKSGVQDRGVPPKGGYRTGL